MQVAMVAMVVQVANGAHGGVSGQAGLNGNSTNGCYKAAMPVLVVNLQHLTVKQYSN